MRLALAILFVVLCILDNIFTYEITKFPHFQELGPIALFFLNIPYGLWIQKLCVCLGLYYFRDRVTDIVLRAINFGMLLIVLNNGYWYYEVMFRRYNEF
jgi:hypothetical protein